MFKSRKKIDGHLAFTWLYETVSCTLAILMITKECLMFTVLQ